MTEEQFSIESYKNTIKQTTELATILRDKLEEFKKNVIAPGDYAIINGKRYIKQSGLNRIATGLKINRAILGSKAIKEYDGTVIGYKAIAKAEVAGIEVKEMGVCYRTEKGKLNIDDFALEQLAMTRAMNRALRKLLAMQEPSAEEMVSEEFIQNEKQESKSTRMQLKIFVNGAPIAPLITPDEFKTIRSVGASLDVRPIVKNGTLYAIEYDASKAAKSNDYEKLKQTIENIVRQKNPLYKDEQINIVSEEE